MPIRIRVQYPGAIYLALSRGDRYEGIFLGDMERQDPVKTMTNLTSQDSHSSDDPAVKSTVGDSRRREFGAIHRSGLENNRRGRAFCHPFHSGSDTTNGLEQLEYFWRKH